MNFTGKGDLIWMEVLPARFSSHFMGQVSENVLNGIGAVLDASIPG
jgi:hypothetical protein